MPRADLPAKPSRAILILSCAVATLTGLVAGYLFGLLGPRPPFADTWTRDSAPPPARASENPSTPSPEAPPALPEAPLEPNPEPQPEPQPEPEPVPPTAEPTPPADPPATPDDGALKIIPAPEAALKAFLSAPDWKSRALHVLHSETTTPKMEAYHATAPDGPTPMLSLRADAVDDTNKDGPRLLSYLVATEAQPAGFPVAVVETPDGWKIDWETFIEFRDDHFGRFAAGQGEDRGAFHVLVRNTHYFGDPFPGSDQLTAFRLDPPLPDRNHYAFVPTGSDLHKTLAGATEWGRPCAPVLQLARKPHGDSKFHIEIESILAPNWRPRE